MKPSEINVDWKAGFDDLSEKLLAEIKFRDAILFRTARMANILQHILNNPDIPNDPEYRKQITGELFAAIDSSGTSIADLTKSVSLSASNQTERTENRSAE